MSRLLLLVAVFAIVYLLLRYYRKQKIKDSASKKVSHEAQAKQAEDMVRCAQCGIHLPKGEGIVVSGGESTAQGEKYFCSEAHRRAYSDPAK